MSPKHDEVAADEVDEVEDEVELVTEQAEVEEVAPVVRAGQWVRLLSKHKKTPPHAVNRDLVVLEAAIRVTDGPSSLGDGHVEYQLPTDPLLVKLRDTGEEFQVPVGAVAMAANERSEFGGR